MRAGSFPTGDALCGDDETDGGAVAREGLGSGSGSASGTDGDGQPAPQLCTPWSPHVFAEAPTGRSPAAKITIANPDRPSNAITAAPTAPTAPTATTATTATVATAAVHHRLAMAPSRPVRQCARPSWRLPGRPPCHGSRPSSTSTSRRPRAAARPGTRTAAQWQAGDGGYHLEHGGARRAGPARQPAWAGSRWAKTSPSLGSSPATRSKQRPCGRCRGCQDDPESLRGARPEGPAYERPEQDHSYQAGTSGMGVSGCVDGVARP